MKSNWNYPTTIWTGENRINEILNACSLLEFKNIIKFTFEEVLGQMLNQTKGFITREQHDLIDAIDYNLNNITNHDILQQFMQDETNNTNFSKNDFIVLILNCLGLNTPKDDLLSILPSSQTGGWYGCVEPNLTSEQIQQPKRY